MKKILKSKNKVLLDEFVALCIHYPEWRFWQALSNFVGGKVIKVNDENTFYWKGKNK